MPIAQYVASFRLNSLDRPEDWKASEDVTYVNVEKNTNNEWHNLRDGILYVNIHKNWFKHKFRHEDDNDEMNQLLNVVRGSRNGDWCLPAVNKGINRWINIAKDMHIHSIDSMSFKKNAK